MRVPRPVYYSCVLSMLVAGPVRTPAQPAATRPPAIATPPADKARDFRIPAADASESLVVFSQQARIAVVYIVEHVRGIRTSATEGRLAPRNALERMVAGTPLIVVEDPRTGTLMIKRRPPAGTPPSAAAPAPPKPERNTQPNMSNPRTPSRAGWLSALVALLSTHPVAGQTTGAAPAGGPGEGATTMAVFEVREAPDQGYRSTQSISGSNTVETLRNTPNSISVLNRELMEDLNITNMAELSMYAVTGESDPDSSTTSTISRFTFRGIVSSFALRNGIVWFTPVDSFNIERAEVLRGPSAFLYGEGVATGVFNQVTKAALPTNFVRPSLTVGSFGLLRGELDLNRKLSRNVFARFNLAHQSSDSYIHHARRDFNGFATSVVYTPGAKTKIEVMGEIGRIRETRPTGTLADRYSTTALNGTTTAYTSATGGFTLVPATGRIYDTVGQRLSAGLAVAITDPAIFPKDVNFNGPNSYHNANYDTVALRFEQRVTEKFNVQLMAAWQEIYRQTRTITGSQSGGVYLDTNRLLPDGTPNPYFNELYTEYAVNRARTDEAIFDARLTAVYDLELPFTSQRIVALGTIHNDIRDAYAAIREYNDPSSAFFKGALINANTLEAHRANVTTLNNNLFYRRFYLKDGDGEALTANRPIAGRTAMMADMGGNTGRGVNGDYRTPSYGAGSSGSYFGGRVRSLVGVRKDYFIRSPKNLFWNPVTLEGFMLPESHQPHNHLSKTSRTVGGVIHLAGFLSGYVNYANSVGLSSGTGGSGFVAGTIRGLSYGDGYEFGLRWSALDGRVESNWTYFINNQRNTGAITPTTATLNEMEALFPNFDRTGADTQSTESHGFEIETVTNLTRHWRLILNFGSSELVTVDRLPVSRAFQAEARARGLATPLLDQFILNRPDGTPVAGYTKNRSNLVTNYRFSSGPLKGLSLGGGFQYRDRTYAGNGDLRRTGVSEMIWWPGYTLLNASAGYDAKLWQRSVRFNLTINNVLDKEYRRASGLTGGLWGSPRSFRLSMRTQL
ncbi:MAG: TonB-dependent receptor plug domain-containing protein [Verrucomicrobia bacterium]|nr:TonB-dependent receptor plug domain-containing protein [Verrucomicrobiota bacterium]